MKRSFHKTELRHLEDRKFEIVISGEEVDRHRTVLSSDGWVLDDYNGVFYWMHSTFNDNPDVALGKSTIRFDKKYMIADAEFPEEGANPLADKVRGHVERGTVNMASVGFAPLEAGRMGDAKKGEPDAYRYGKRELLEWSLVHIGSFRQAFKRDLDEVNNYVKDEMKRLSGEGDSGERGDENASKVIHPNVGVARSRYYHFFNQN